MLNQPKSKWEAKLPNPGNRRRIKGPKIPDLCDPRNLTPPPSYMEEWNCSLCSTNKKLPRMLSLLLTEKNTWMTPPRNAAASLPLITVFRQPKSPAIKSKIPC